MFNQHVFEQLLATSWLGQSFLYQEELDSTNTYLKDIDRGELVHGLTVLADTQTHGRGQYKRTWFAEPQKNLTFSMAFMPTKPERFHVLTLAFALAISEYVETVTEKESHIKWANDVYVDGKKIAGLLTETIFSGQKLNRIIIGIGFNVNQSEFGDEVSDIAISLSRITDKEFRREHVLSDLLTRCEHYYRLWHQQDRNLIKKINNRLIGIGEWIQLEVNNELIDGIYKFIGINERGNLLVLNKELEAHTFSYEQIKVHLT